MVTQKRKKEISGKKHLTEEKQWLRAAMMT
jgi:hypothetical protein